MSVKINQPAPGDNVNEATMVAWFKMLGVGRSRHDPTDRLDERTPALYPN